MRLPRIVPLTLLNLAIAMWSLAGCTSPPPGHGEGTRIREEPVEFTNGDVRLSGTLVLPAAGKRSAAVVLLHGSGPEARNIGMARWFAEQGVAALTYDKRGVGASTGDFRKVPFMDLHLDGLAGVAFLRQRPDIDASRIGVWGLSQGGWLGPLAASRSRNVAFVIAVSGPGVSPGEQMVFYYANQLRADGVPDEQVQAITTLRRLVWQAMFEGTDLAIVRARIDKARAQASAESVKTQLDDLSQALQHPGGLWITREMNYDPVVALRQLTVPSLFIFGQDDQVVPIEASIEIILRTLTDTRHSDFTIKTFPGADHGLQVRDADGLRRPAPEYLSTMRDWLLARVTR
jgi:pimeloyl-ACP methyl ester carboxylesterase